MAQRPTFCLHLRHPSLPLLRHPVDMATSSEVLPGRTALVLYGSETGNAQDVAEELGRLTERLRFATQVSDLNSVQLVRTSYTFNLSKIILDQTSELLSAGADIIMFFFSESVAPPLCCDHCYFHDWPRGPPCECSDVLEGAQKRAVTSRMLAASPVYYVRPGRHVVPKVRQPFTSVVMFSDHPRFNWASRKLYNRLVQLGAQPIHDRGEADEQHPEGWVSEHLLRTKPADSLFHQGSMEASCLGLSI